MGNSWLGRESRSLSGGKNCLSFSHAQALSPYKYKGCSMTGGTIQTLVLTHPPTWPSWWQHPAARLSKRPVCWLGPGDPLNGYTGNLFLDPLNPLPFKLQVSLMPTGACGKRTQTHIWGTHPAYGPLISYWWLQVLKDYWAVSGPWWSLSKKCLYNGAL